MNSFTNSFYHSFFKHIMTCNRTTFQNSHPTNCPEARPSPSKRPVGEFSFANGPHTKRGLCRSNERQSPRAPYFSALVIAQSPFGSTRCYRVTAGRGGRRSFLSENFAKPSFREKVSGSHPGRPGQLHRVLRQVLQGDDVHAHVVGAAVTLLVLAHGLDGAHIRVGGRHRGHAGHAATHGLGT